MTAHTFLVNLALVLCVAAAATVVFQRLRQPVVLGYVLAGLVVGPHVPIPLVADPHVVEALSELGVLLLMFSIGLEFRLGKLAEVASTGGLVALLEVGTLGCLGWLAASAFGWTPVECLFTGAVVSISSTSIIAKTFEEQAVTGRRRDVVFGVLVAEDLLAILMMAGLTLLATGREPTLGDLGVATLRLGASLGGLLVAGLLIVPPLFRAIVALGRPETTTVASVGLCFAVAQATAGLGYSVALGAFLAGMLVAESGHGHEIAHEVRPVRDVFAAIFFVAVGMTIDPALVLTHWAPVTVLVLVVLLGKVLAVSLGAFLVGNGTRTAIATGMSLAQIGEFSFILAGLGVSLGVVGPQLYPVAVAVSAITTFTTPAFVRAADRVAGRVDHWLPAPLQTLSSLYGAWLDAIRAAPPSESRRARVRALLRGLAIDTAVLVGVIVTHGLFARSAGAWLAARFGLPPALGYGLVVAGEALLGVPVAFTLIRAAGRFGTLLAEPLEAGGGWSRSPALHGAWVAAVRLGVVLGVAVVVVTLTRPFLDPLGVALTLLVLGAALLTQVWRRAADVQGELRSGAEQWFDTLRRHAAGDGAPGQAGGVTLTADDRAVGRTLIELDLRSRTGATVLLLTAGGRPPMVPTGHERLAAGDRLALAGSRESIAAALEVLARPVA